MQFRDSAADAWHNCRLPRQRHRHTLTQGSPLVTKERVMLHPTGTRVRLIDSVVRGRSRNEGPSAPEYVKRSWLRCLNEYGLDPDSRADPVVVSRQDLLARKEQNLELVSFADVEMANLYQQLAGSGYSIILTDRDRVLLSYYGDPSFKRAASRTALLPAPAWIERPRGPTAMGTCLL